MSEWRTVRLEDIAANEKSSITKPYGSAILKGDYVDSGVPVVRGVNLAQGRFHDADFVFITEDLADTMPGSRLRPGDLVFTHRGSVGQVSMIPRHPRYDRYAVSTSQVKARLDPAVALPEFYYYWFRSPRGQHAILQCASTVGVPGIAQPVATVKSLEVPLPPLSEQHGIAAALGVLDDKIESNRRVVSLLEQRLLLEFEKVKAAGSIVRTPLSEVAKLTKGVSYKSVDLQPSRTSLVTLKSFDRRGGYKSEGLKQYVGKYKPEQVIVPGEVVVAQTDLTQGAEVVGRAVRVPADDSADMLVASLDLVIVRSEQVSRDYLLGVLSDANFREHCRSRTSGTTVLHLAADAIPSYEAPIAAPQKQAAFSETSRIHLELIDCRNRESERLTALRDELLLELLAGRIRVPEAQEAVAEVSA